MLNREDQWCSLLQGPRVLEILRHADEVDSYWKKGYGHELNWEMATPLLQRLHSEMIDHLHHNSTIQASFRFAHAETLLPLLCLLNLMPKLPPQLKEGQDTETFSTSHTMPFAANLGILLLERPTGELEVALVLNEHLRAIPFCEQKLLCPWKQFEQHLQPWLHTWNFEQQCETA